MSTPVKIALWAFVLGLLWMGASSGETPTKPENCWSQYQTEEEAILNCENHDDN